ncbi:MAG: ABC transporter substrate-binding protein [Betaproteobacteria bacterium]|nr:ABC transporter substrate-binding protein [Betaproteobacteria bacterium]
MNARRDFLTLLGTGALAAALPAFSQQSQFRVGWLSPSRVEDGLQLLDALRQGLRDLGYVEGRNMVLEMRWGDDSSARVEKLAGELVALKPQVIVAQGPTAAAVRRVTTTIPVVFGFSGDPVRAGFVESLSHPGGNLTGISFLALDLVGKRIELLKEMMPQLKRIAIVANPQHPGDQAERRESETAATAIGLTIEYFDARGQSELGDALSAIQKSRNQAVVMFPVASVMSARERIAAWAIKHHIPAVSGWAQFAEGGNLMSYGPNQQESFRRLAAYVDRILKGARPAELPVELPTRVELVVNLKTAKALGVTIPQSVLLRADRVIE